MIVTVTKEQAAYLASLVQQAHQAQRAYTQVLALLTLGHVEPGATLANIDTENGALEFAEPARSRRAARSSTRWSWCQRIPAPMAIERAVWRPVTAWPALNAMAARLFDILVGSDRWAFIPVSVSSTLAPTWPLTVVLVDTSAGNVTVTLPPPASIIGFRLEIKKRTAANTLTVASAANIDGAGTLAWTTQYQSYSLISDGSTYHVV